MKKKQIVDLIIAIFLIICGCILLLFPVFHFMKVKLIFLIILGIYGVLNLIQYLLTKDSKDYEGLLTTVASLITFVIAVLLDIDKTPWYLALSLFIWIILMSLIKLKKADYYHDRKNKIWILRVVTLGLFILTGVLTTINLRYTSDIQVLVLGYFFFIHGILELVDPITNYLREEK